MCRTYGKRHGAGDGRKHQLARGAAAAGDVHVQQAGLAGDPCPRDSECRSPKVKRRQGNAPARATEEPRPARVDDAIRRRLRRLRQSSQEIANLPPDAAAVLQAAGTKHENADRWRRQPIAGIPGPPIAWSTEPRMTPSWSWTMHMHQPLRAVDLVANRRRAPSATAAEHPGAKQLRPRLRATLSYGYST